MSSDTIVAPATPHGFGGIAVVRLSGSQSKFISSKLLNNNCLDRKFSPKTATLSNIYDENGRPIDETVYTYFISPNSYPGEDLIEVSCHGNPNIVEKIVSVCCAYGARIAEPGEFTRRAFINGKVDLVQAESVASLINSQSEESSKLNLRLLRGELSGKLNTIRAELINVLSLIEFELDISEDELLPDLENQLKSIIDTLIVKIDLLLVSYRQARLLNKGAVVVIAGAPNVGKSTLLNALTETHRAITSDLPGTTRDAIDVPLVLNGVPINLIDTAGIRDSDEIIEKEGVRRSVDYMNKADLIILVDDNTSCKACKIDTPKDIATIKIINKIDLESNRGNFEDALPVSAKMGEGLNQLKQNIKQLLGISSALADTLSITTSRQQLSLKNCRNNLNTSIELLDNSNISYELLSIEIRDALESIGAILGKTTPDDILNNIFGQFCVGK